MHFGLFLGFLSEKPKSANNQTFYWENLYSNSFVQVLKVHHNCSPKYHFLRNNFHKHRLEGTLAWLSHVS